MFGIDMRQRVVSRLDRISSDYHMFLLFVEKKLKEMLKISKMVRKPSMEELKWF